MANEYPYLYDETAASNTEINGISIAEGMNPSAVNNAIRELLSQFRELLNDIFAQNTSAGTDTITLTTDSTLTAYEDGIGLMFIAGGTNTGAATLNVDSVGAKAVVKGDGAATALAAGDIVAGMPVFVVYDASVGSGSWLMINPISGLASYLSSVAADTTPQLGGDLDVNGSDITSPDGTDLIDIVNGTITIQTASSTRLDITDSGVQLGGSGARVTTVLDEDAMGTDSATALATQQSIKAYVDAQIAANASIAVKVISHTSDTALATQAGGGSLMGTWSSATIPTAGCIRVTVARIEYDETEGNTAAAQLGIKIGTDSIIWASTDTAGGTPAPIPYFDATGSATSILTNAGWIDGPGTAVNAPGVMSFDIAGLGMSTGTQDIAIYLGDNVDSEIGEITITGTTVAAKFLVEVIDGT